MNKLRKICEENEPRLEEQSKQINQLNEVKVQLENELKIVQSELNEIRVKFENSTVFIHHSVKASSLLKEEKDSLDKILKDNAIKLETLKKNYDELFEKYSNIESQYNDAIADKVLIIKKLNETKNLNEIISNEKEDCNKVKFVFDLNCELVLELVTFYLKPKGIAIS